MNWLNEPASWQQDGADLVVRSDAKTDFWRKTHDNGIRDNGHFYGQHVQGDFTAEVKVIGQYSALYDHAGIMVRLDEAHWMKCGVEYVEDVQYASVVATRDYSDWSVTRLQRPEALWLRVKRHAFTLEVSFSIDGTTYTMMRQAYLTDAPVAVGPMIASPIGSGFTARFADFHVTPGYAYS